MSRNSNFSISGAAFFVALGTMSSRLLGYLREILIVYYFPRMETDAWYVAFRLPNLFRRLFGEGALTVSFIPVLTDYLKNDDWEGARRLAAAIFTVLLTVLSVITVVFVFYADPIVSGLVSGENYAAVPGKLELTATFTKISFAYVILVSLYAFSMGILNTAKVFFLPAMAPAIWNMTVIIGMVFFRDSFNIPIHVLAWSTLVGGVFQLGILIPTLSKLGYQPRLVKFWQVKGVGQVFKSFVPSVFGLSVLQFGVIINTHFASHLEQGTNTWISVADRLLELPLSLIAVSLGTAALPSLAELWSKNLKGEMAKASQDVLEMTLFLAVPCALAVFIYSEVLVTILFKRGKFNLDDTLKTAMIVQIYSFQILFAGAVRVLAPSFYAAKNTWLPALSAALSLGLHILIAPKTMALYGVAGLVGSSVLASGINATILILCFSFMIAPMTYGSLLYETLAIFFNSAISVLPIGLMLRPWILNPQITSFPKVEQMTLFTLASLASLLLYILVGRALGLKHANQLINLIRRKLRF